MVPGREICPFYKRLPQSIKLNCCGFEEMEVKGAANVKRDEGGAATEEEESDDGEAEDMEQFEESGMLEMQDEVGPI